MKKLILFLFCLLCFLVTSANSTVINSTGINTWDNVSGAMMRGMKVYVNGDSSNAKTWEAGSGVSGSASGTGWSLKFDSGNTHTNINNRAYWELTTGANFSLSSITIDAYSGGTYFDIFSGYYNPNYQYDADRDTPNSMAGYFQFIPWDSRPSATIDGNSTVSGDTTTSYSTSALNDYNGPNFEWEFSNPIQITGDTTPRGDLWGTLTLTFPELLPLAGGSTVLFGADTDLDSTKLVPEPSTLFLFGIGLLGMGALGRKKS
ncbi:MAG: PEP-CTERM sorting domain-containing protein [Pseudomonadota bacterium]